MAKHMINTNLIRRYKLHGFVKTTYMHTGTYMSCVFG